MVLVEVLIAGNVELYSGSVRPPVRSFTLKMHNLGSWNVQNVESGIRDPLAPIRFLEEEKEPLIQRAHLRQAFHVYSHARTYDPGYDGGVPSGKSWS